jgi:TatD DNase family protein
MINIGTGEATSQKAVEMLTEFPEGVYAIVGLHPIHAVESRGEPAEIFNADFYQKLVVQGGKKVVGIGECGFDYIAAVTPEDKARQEKAFRAQIELALELDLPLMLHIRSGDGGDAYKDALTVLKEYKAKPGVGDKLRGDAHFFAGSLEETRGFLELGFHLSYTGVVTFAKQYKELVEATPMDRIMSETDCPYVAPIPVRGTRNEPFNVTYTAEKILDIKGVSPEKGRAQLVENAFKLWNL